MASELRVNTLKDAAGNNSVGMEYVANGSAKAWWNANGTGTIVINDSFNCSSIADQATGVIKGNFGNALTNSSYSLIIGSNTAASNSAWNRVQITDSSSGTSRHYEGGSLVDTTINIVNCHGDLA